MGCKSEKINLTNTYISNLPVALERYHHYDQRVSGLGIMVFPTGVKTYFLYMKHEGKPQRFKIGRFPDISVENARTLALKLKCDITNGIDPKAKKKAAERDITFAALFDHYIEKHAKHHKKKWKEDKAVNRLYIGVLSNKKIAAISQTDINSLHKRVGQEIGTRTANIVLNLIRGIYNKAIEWDLFTGKNPALGVTRFREVSRDRFLQPDELPKLFASLEQEHNHTVRDFVFICLFTGVRRGNVLAMRWEEINFTAASWHIKETKNGTSQVVALTTMAIEVLEKRRKLTNSEWVFPSETSKSGHLEEPKKVWKRILERAGIANFRIHDLRRSIGSYMAATGANSFIIGKALNHKSVAATAIYARLNIDPVRQSLETATQAMFNMKAQS